MTKKVSFILGTLFLSSWTFMAAQPTMPAAISPQHRASLRPYAAGSSISTPSAEGNISLKWSDSFPMAESAASCEDGQIIPVSDGSVGVYTTGGQTHITKGMVVKLDQSGQSVWELSLQISSETTAKRVSVAENGEIYVAGTTVVDGVAHPYLARISSHGSLVSTKTFDIKNDRIGIEFLGIDNADVNLLVTSRDSNWEGGYYFYRLDSELTVTNSQTYTQTGSLQAPINVLYSNRRLVAVLASGPYNEGSLMVFNTEEDGRPKTFAGNYQDGTVVGDDYYFVLKNSSSYSVQKCTLGAGGPAPVWTCPLEDFDTNYFSPMVRAGDDGNVYLWHRAQDTQRIAKISGSDGACVWSRAIADFGDTGISSGFVYAMGVDSNGDFVAGGHTGDFRIFWYRLASADGSLSHYDVSLVDDRYAYVYSYDNMSIYSGGKFYFSGWLKTASLVDGNFPFFAMFDTNSECGLTWHAMAPADFSSNNIPCEGYLTSDGTSYVAVTVSKVPGLAKYSPEGEFLWFADCDVAEGQARFVFPDGDQAFTLVSTAKGADWSKTFLLLTDFSGDGNRGSSRIFENSMIKPTLLTAYKNADGSLTAVWVGNDASWNKTIVLQTVGQDGTSTFQTSNVEGQFQPYAAFVDQSGCVLVVGNCYDNDGVSSATVYKIAADGSLLYSQQVETPGSLYGAWSDSEGNTYVCGASNDQYAFYAKLDASGAVASKTVTQDSGFYEMIIGNENAVNLVGTVVPQGSRNIVARVLDLNPADASVNWITDISSDSGTYGIKGVYTGDNIVIAGYETDNFKVSDMVAVLDKDGKITGKSVADPIYNSKQDYIITQTLAREDMFMVLSAYSASETALIGKESLYSLSGTGGLNNVGAPSPVVATYYYNLSGLRVMNPLAGVYFKVEIHADSSRTVTKIAK